MDRLQPLIERREVSAAQVFDAQQLLVQAQLQQRSAEAQLQLLMVGPKPEAVAEAQARLEAAEGTLAHSASHAGVAHDPLADRRRTRQSDVSPRTDHYDRHADRRSRQHAASSRRRVVAAPLGKRSSRRTNRAALAIGDAVPHHPSPPRPRAKPACRARSCPIGRIVDPQTGNLPVRILVENEAGRVAVGETLTVTILVRQRVNELAVPSVGDFRSGRRSAFARRA